MYSSTDFFRHHTTNALAYALSATFIWVAILLLLANAGSMSIDYFIGFEALAIFIPLFLMNRNLGRLPKKLAFRKRLGMNARYGSILLVLFVLAQAVASSVFGMEMLPQGFDNFQLASGAPIAVMSMITLAYIILSIFICMVVFRRRIGGLDSEEASY